MKIYNPPKRLEQLDLVKKYDSEQEPILIDHERHAINVERAKIMRNESHVQHESLENKIQHTLKKIIQTEWQPANKIRYDKDRTSQAL